MYKNLYKQCVAILHVMWNKVDRRSDTVMLRGGAPAEQLDDIFEASELATALGLSKKDAEWAYVSFCVKFTTNELIKLKRKMEEQDAPTRNTL